MRAAYDFQLLLKHVLEYGVAWAPNQEIVYRDQVRHSYTTMYQRVLRLAGALQALGVKPGTKVGEGVIASWAVPDNYVFVDELPKTGIGKIDKKVLRSRHPAP